MSSEPLGTAHAAAQELRRSGIHVALLIVDGIIESPRTAQMSAGMSPDALVRQQDVADAVRFLATQTLREDHRAAVSSRS